MAQEGRSMRGKGSPVVIQLANLRVGVSLTAHGTCMGERARIGPGFRKNALNFSGARHPATQGKFHTTLSNASLPRRSIHPGAFLSRCFFFTLAPPAGAAARSPDKAMAVRRDSCRLVASTSCNTCSHRNAVRHASVTSAWASIAALYRMYLARASCKTKVVDK